jgi:hypothetical protein
MPLCKIEFSVTSYLFRDRHKFDSSFFLTELVANGDQWKLVEIYVFDRNDMLSLQTSRGDKGHSLLPSNHSVKTKAFHLGNDKYLPRIERNTVTCANCHRATRLSV